MILILCANAGVDRTYEVPEFAAGRSHHPDRVLVSAGGKGLNVARVLTALRQPVTVTGFAGGRAGAFVAGDLRGLGLRALLTQIREEPRTTLTVVDPKNKRVTRLDEWGPLVSPAEIEGLRQQWKAALPGTQFAIIAGNPPRGVPRDLYARLLHDAAREKIPTALDAHEEHLQAALAGRPYLLKPNLRELSWLAKRPLDVPEGVVNFSRELLSQGVYIVMTTLGKQGAIVVARDAEPLLVTAPETEMISTVGAGDAALAGFVAALVEGRPLADRARWAMAAGAADCAALAAGACTREQIEALVPLVTVEPLGLEGNLPMFGVSQADILVILLLILLLFGPKKIPEIMRGLGTGLRDLKRASREATDEFHRLTTDEPEPPARPSAEPPADFPPSEKPT